MLFIEMLLRTAPFSTLSSGGCEGWGGSSSWGWARRVHASDRLCLKLAIDPVNHVAWLVILPVLFGFMCTVKMFSTKMNYFLPFVIWKKLCKLRKLVPFFFSFLFKSVTVIVLNGCEIFILAHAEVTVRSQAARSVQTYRRFPPYVCLEPRLH